MSWRIVSLALQREEDVVAARMRARQLAGKLGFELQDQTRIATSVSEIARNAVAYGKGGSVDFALDDSLKPQLFEITVKDQGGGIKELGAILSGAYRSPTGMGKGIVGTRRLMDVCEIATGPKGTSVRLGKRRPYRLRAMAQKDLGPLSKALAEEDANPLEELREQNRELLQSLQDLTARSEEMEELAEELESTNRGVVALHGELEATAQELRRASELKTRFLSNMSHEFRTPLNSIVALTRLLLARTDGELSTEQERQVRFICDAANGLSELVNDLLDIAKVEAGKIDVRPSKFSVFEMFGALKGLMKPLQTNDKVELVFEEPSGVPILFTDEGKVTQILRNFVANALKYTESGSVRISAEFREPDRILFTVRDTGIGIAPEHHDRIFEEFEQVAGMHQTKIKGTGLGLPLSRRLAELLHGDVAVDSKPGKGSSFFLDIPARWTSEGPGPVLAPPDKPKDKLRVLVADDDETFRYVIRRMMDGKRYDIIEAADGEAALEAIHNAAPDLVILDLSMPRRDGYSVLDEMARDECTRRIPVVVSSSLALSDRDRARLARSHAILSKATLSSELLSAVLSDAMAREQLK